ncbi:MAG: hypothetical protein OEY30_00195 [Candidatus Bathyarchaeota archaeon]|nr:hypothetical protein [Candidatus Bathyarchaeota archaeon]
MKITTKNKYDLLKYDSIKRMIQAMRAKRSGVPAPSTEKGFLTYIYRFVIFFSKERGKFFSPDDIIAERKQHWLSTDDDVRRQHEETAVRFMNMLGSERTRGKIASSGKVAFALTAVRAFYRENYRELKGITTPAVTTETTYKVPTPEELVVACEQVRENNKRLLTWMLCDKDSGMSPGDLLNLTGQEESACFGTILKQLKKGQIPVHIHIIRQKTKAKGLGFYDTFLGEDGAEALQDFLHRRRRIRKLFNIGDRMLQIEFAQLAKELGWKNFVPKSCRKFFKSELTFKSDLKNVWTEYFMGHSIKKQELAYLVEALKDRPEEMAAIYNKNYKHLKLPF